MLETENNIWYFGTDFFFLQDKRGASPRSTTCSLFGTGKEGNGIGSYLVPTGDVTILMLSAVICLLGFNLSGSN